LHIKDIPQGGKGNAVRVGFQEALDSSRKYDLIGFVEMQIWQPSLYILYELITKIDGHDGVIASRYAKGAQDISKAPTFKKNWRENL